MENPPEQKGQKQKHNVRTLKKMAEMMVRIIHEKPSNKPHTFEAAGLHVLYLLSLACSLSHDKIFDPERFLRVFGAAPDVA